MLIISKLKTISNHEKNTIHINNHFIEFEYSGSEANQCHVRYYQGFFMHEKRRR